MHTAAAQLGASCSHALGGRTAGWAQAALMHTAAAPLPRQAGQRPEGSCTAMPTSCLAVQPADQCHAVPRHAGAIMPQVQPEHAPVPRRAHDLRDAVRGRDHPDVPVPHGQALAVPQCARRRVLRAQPLPPAAARWSVLAAAIASVNLRPCASGATDPCCLRIDANLCSFGGRSGVVRVPALVHLLRPLEHDEGARLSRGNYDPTAWPIA